MTVLSRLGLTGSRLARVPSRPTQWIIRFCSDFSLKEKRIDVVTCRHLFPKHPHPPGLNFEVKYLDESPASDVGILADDKRGRNFGRLPIVLMLHGSPGSYADFKSQIECLVKRGARVLAPNFPDLPTIRKYNNPSFRNTPLNKSSLVRDFLKALGIPKVDMLVTHSSGVYAGLRLYRSSEPPDIDAFAMINPAGHWHTCTNPRWFYQSLGELVHWRLGYALCNAIGMRIFPLLGPVDVPNIDEPLLSLTAIRSFNLKEVEKGLHEVASRKPPLLFTFSENDKLIGRHVSYDMLRILGVDRPDWWFYDSLGQLKSEGKENDWMKAISFAAGSHYSLRKHPENINIALLQLFNRLPISKTVLDRAELELEQEMERLLRIKQRELEQKMLLQPQVAHSEKKQKGDESRRPRGQLHDDNSDLFPAKQLKARL